MARGKRALCVLLLLLAGCQGGSSIRPEPGDGPPQNDIDVSGIPDAVPRYEPITRAGNKSPYEILGKTYHVMPSARGYREVGTASWYGTKFHGRKTANGEDYSMYEMTAAHTSLPIPSYIRVTNLANGRSVIVRVNDRGPFHGGRIVDLSYAAAKKLGYASQGTARVEVAAIDPGNYQRTSVEIPRVATVSRVPPAIGASTTGRLPDNTFLQVGAFGSQRSAQFLRARVSQITAYPVAVRVARTSAATLFKVLVGPVTDHNQLIALRSHLQQSERLSPFVVYDALLPD